MDFQRPENSLRQDNLLAPQYTETKLSIAIAIAMPSPPKEKACHSSFKPEKMETPWDFVVGIAYVPWFHASPWPPDG